MALRAAFEPLFGATVDAQTLPSTENSSPRRRSAKSSQRRFALIDGLDARAGRTFAAQFDHGEDQFFRSGEQRLDRAVAAVAHPTFDAAFERHQFGPGAEADALHPAADDDLEDHVHPNSFKLCVPAPSGCAGNQSCSEAI